MRIPLPSLLRVPMFHAHCLLSGALTHTWVAGCVIVSLNRQRGCLISAVWQSCNQIWMIGAL
jgi:hypothetical protein